MTRRRMRRLLEPYLQERGNKTESHIVRVDMRMICFDLVLSKGLLRTSKLGLMLIQISHPPFREARNNKHTMPNILISILNTCVFSFELNHNLAWYFDQRSSWNVFNLIQSASIHAPKKGSYASHWTFSNTVPSAFLVLPLRLRFLPPDDEESFFTWKLFAFLASSFAPQASTVREVEPASFDESFPAISEEPFRSGLFNRRLFLFFFPIVEDSEINEYHLHDGKRVLEARIWKDTFFVQWVMGGGNLHFRT